MKSQFMKLLLPIPGICFLFRLRVSFYPCSRLFLFFRIRFRSIPVPGSFSSSDPDFSQSPALSPLKICPRHSKHRPHTHTDCSPVKRIATPCGQQHRIHSSAAAERKIAPTFVGFTTFSKTAIRFAPCRHSAPKGAAAGTSHRAFLWSVENPSAS